MKKLIKKCIREALYGEEDRSDKQRQILKQNIFQQTRILQIYNELVKDVVPAGISSEYKKQLIKINNLINKNNTFDFFGEFVKSEKTDILKAAKPLDILPKIEKYNTFSIKTVFNVAEKVLQKMIAQAKEKKQMLNEDSEEISKEILTKFGSREIDEADLPFLSRDLARAEKRRVRQAKKEKGRERRKGINRLKMNKKDLMEIITLEVEKYMSEEEESDADLYLKIDKPGFKFEVGEAVTDKEEPDTSKWLGKIIKREMDDDAPFYHVVWAKCGDDPDNTSYTEWQKDLSPAQESVDEEKIPREKAGVELSKLKKKMDKYQQKGKIEKVRDLSKQASALRKKWGIPDVTENKK